MSENFTPWESIQSESDRKLVKLRAEVADLRAEIERLQEMLNDKPAAPEPPPCPPRHGYAIDY